MRTAQKKRQRLAAYDTSSSRSAVSVRDMASAVASVMNSTHLTTVRRRTQRTDQYALSGNASTNQQHHRHTQTQTQTKHNRTTTTTTQKTQLPPKTVLAPCRRLSDPGSESCGMLSINLQCDSESSRRSVSDTLNTNTVAADKTQYERSRTR